MPNEDRDATQPLGFGSSAGLGPLVWVADWWYEHLADGKQSCAAPAMMWPDPHDKTGLVPLYDQAALDEKEAEIQRLRMDLENTRAEAVLALETERKRWRDAMERLADALEARLGTNAAEWADVQQARALLERA